MSKLNLNKFKNMDIVVDGSYSQQWSEFINKVAEQIKQSNAYYLFSLFRALNDSSYKMDMNWCLPVIILCCPDDELTCSLIDECVKYGVNINVVMNDSYTPLSVAIKNRSNIVIYHMLKYNPHINDSHLNMAKLKGDVSLYSKLYFMKNPHLLNSSVQVF